MALRPFPRTMGRTEPRILLIDNDDDALLELYRELVETEGYAVYTCPHPFVQPEVIAQLRPDVIVLDLVHSGQRQGWLMLTALRAYEDTRTTPVVICTDAVHEAEAQARTFRDRAVHTIVKPFGLVDFLGTLLAALARGGQPV
jgi:DNA-binding response OmpR family regulator